MAVDLSIQVFSYELLSTILIDHGILPCKPATKADIESVYCGYTGESHFNIDIIQAVYCRQVIFHNIFRMQFEYTEIHTCDSPSDFLAHIYAAFSSPEFKDLKVFERVFASCAFVVEALLFCFYNRNPCFVTDAYLCWAMYIDTELKCNFYEQGGWTMLKSIARSYISPFLVIRMRVNYDLMYQYRSVLHTVPLQKLVAGIEDFYDFQKFSDAGENLTRGKPWVKYRLNSNNNSRKSSRLNFDLTSFEGLEKFLRYFKFLSDPLGEMVLDLNYSSHNGNSLSKRDFFASAELEEVTKKLSDCNIDSYTDHNASLAKVPKPNDLSSKIHYGTVSGEGNLAQEVQPKVCEHRLTERRQDQEKELSVNNTGLLRIYDKLQDLLGVKDVQTALSHVPVFMLDHYLDQYVTGNQIALEQVSDAKKYTKGVLIEKGQQPVKKNSQVSHAVNKKRTNLRRKSTAVDGYYNNNIANKENKCVAKPHEDYTEYCPDCFNASSEITKEYVNNKESSANKGHFNEDIEDIKDDAKRLRTNSEVYLDDTKDVLRMVLVLGTQPGKNYVLSTLKDTKKASNF